MDMKKIIENLQKKKLTYLIYNTEQTWASKGINPITATIK